MLKWCVKVVGKVELFSQLPPIVVFQRSVGFIFLQFNKSLCFPLLLTILLFNIPIILDDICVIMTYSVRVQCLAQIMVLHALKRLLSHIIVPLY